MKQSSRLLYSENLLINLLRLFWWFNYEFSILLQMSMICVIKTGQCSQRGSSSRAVTATMVLFIGDLPGSGGCCNQIQWCKPCEMRMEKRAFFGVHFGAANACSYSLPVVDIDLHYKFLPTIIAAPIFLWRPIHFVELSLVDRIWAELKYLFPFSHSNGTATGAQVIGLPACCFCYCT